MPFNHDLISTTTIDAAQHAATTPANSMSTTLKTQKTVLLKGTISHLRCRRGSTDFLFSQQQKDNLAGAIFADLLSGNDGVGASLASMSDITTETADYLTFDLDNNKVEACVWASHFNDGDEVHVVVEFLDGGWKGFAIHRPSDGLTAVYPHCTRGRFAHWKSTTYWFFVLSLISYIVLMAIVYFPFGRGDDFFSFAKIAAPAVFFVTAFFAILGAWKFKNIVRMAERIFTTFGWPQPKWVDLRSGVKKRKIPGDPPAFGIALFRYQPKF